MGAEILRLRSAAGLTRSQFLDLTDTDLHVHTLSTYEKGTRQISVQCFVDFCTAAKVSAPDVLATAILRAKTDLGLVPLRIDLNAIVVDKRKELKALRNWARVRLNAIPREGSVVTLAQSTVSELAIVFGYGDIELMTYLMDFLAAPRVL